MEILQVGHVADKEISKIKIQFHHHDQQPFNSKDLIVNSPLNLLNIFL